MKRENERKAPKKNDKSRSSQEEKEDEGMDGSQSSERDTTRQDRGFGYSFSQDTTIRWEDEETDQM